MQDYELTTLQDLLKVPADKREECVRQLLMGLLLSELAFADFDANTIPMTFIWTDDDSKDVSVICNDEPIISMRVTCKP